MARRLDSIVRSSLDAISDMPLKVTDEDCMQKLDEVLCCWPPKSLSGGNQQNQIKVEKDKLGSWLTNRTSFKLIGQDSRFLFSLLVPTS